MRVNWRKFARSGLVNAVFSKMGYRLTLTLAEKALTVGIVHPHLLYLYKKVENKVSNQNLYHTLNDGFVYGVLASLILNGNATGPEGPAQSSA
jgi:hypothetical protein